MILDRLEHVRMYRPLAVDIARALDYLQQTNFRDLADGRYELDGDRLFAIVQRYRPKPAAEAIVGGASASTSTCSTSSTAANGWDTPICAASWSCANRMTRRRTSCSTKPQGDLVEVPAGSFVIFTPHDVHAPGLTTDPPEQSSQVCKVVREMPGRRVIRRTATGTMLAPLA